MGIWLRLPVGLAVGVTTLAPTLALGIMTRIVEGRAGLERLLHRVVAWRAGLAVYAVALAGLPLVYPAGTLILLA